MKRIVFPLLFIVLMFSSCDLFDLLNVVEVSYSVDFYPQEEGVTATLTYYNPGNKIVTHTMEPGTWSLDGYYRDGDSIGVWVDTDAQKGSVGVSIVVWYSDLEDKEDLVLADTWLMPQTGRVGLSNVVSNAVKCYNTAYSVVVEGTNGVPVDIQYSENDYESGSLLAEASKNNGTWNYSECFPVGAYASVMVTSEATSGTATINIKIDYDDKAPVNKSLTIDFSTSTKSGSLGFPVE